MPGSEPLEPAGQPAQRDPDDVLLVRHAPLSHAWRSRSRPARSRSAIRPSTSSSTTESRGTGEVVAARATSSNEPNQPRTASWVTSSRAGHSAASSQRITWLARTSSRTASTLGSPPDAPRTRATYTPRLRCHELQERAHHVAQAGVDVGPRVPRDGLHQPIAGAGRRPRRSSRPSTGSSGTPASATPRPPRPPRPWPAPGSTGSPAGPGRCRPAAGAGPGPTCAVAPGRPPIGAAPGPPLRLTCSCRRTRPGPPPTPAG